MNSYSFHKSQQSTTIFIEIENWDHWATETIETCQPLSLLSRAAQQNTLKNKWRFRQIWGIASHKFISIYQKCFLIRRKVSANSRSYFFLLSFFLLLLLLSSKTFFLNFAFSLFLLCFPLLPDPTDSSLCPPYALVIENRWRLKNLSTH